MTVSTIDYALMAGASYFSTRKEVNRLPHPESNGWARLGPEFGLDRDQNDASGFEAAAFVHGNEIVISYAGTYDKSKADLAADAGLGAGGLDRQLIDAALYYQKIKEKYPTAQVTFTGHSLGGGLAALMGVFFDKKAVTFDAAPFRAAASNTNAVGLAAILLANGYVDGDLATFRSFGAIPGAVSMPLVIRGESKVSVLSMAGEFLTVLSAGGRIGTDRDQIAPHGGMSEDFMSVLHSQALLIAFYYNDSLRAASVALPQLVHDLFDAALFKNDTDTNSRDLLTHLIRYEFGIPGDPNSKKGLLSKFSSDAALVASLGTDDMDLKQGLMQIAMESYYNTVSSDGKQLFQAAGNGIQFDLTGNIGDSAIDASSLKGYVKLKDAILSHVSGDGTAEVTQYLNESRRITLVFGKGGGADAEDDATGDYMMLGANGGWLNGKGGDDLLVGGNGMDALTGGAGDDTLIGGNGIDSYLYKAGDGDDTVIDSDKKGRVFIISADGKTTYAASIFTKDKNNPGNDQSADGLGRCRRAKLSVRGTGLRRLLRHIRAVETQRQPPIKSALKCYMTSLLSKIADDRWVVS